MQIRWKKEDLLSNFLQKTQKTTKEQQQYLKTEQLANDNLAIYHNLLQDIKTNIIIQLPQQYSSMIKDLDSDDYKDNSLLDNSNIFKKNTEINSNNSNEEDKNNSNRIESNFSELAAKEFYEKYAITGGIEKRFFVSNKSLLTNEDRIYLKNFKTELESEIIKENNIENTKTFVKTIDLTKIENDDNLKLAVIEVILDKQKKIKEDLLAINQGMIIEQTMILEGKKNSFLKNSYLNEQSIQDVKVQLIRELYKSVFTFEPKEYNRYQLVDKIELDEDGKERTIQIKEDLLDENGDVIKGNVKFSSYLFSKIKSKCILELKKYFKIVNEENEYKKIDINNIEFIDQELINNSNEEKRLIDDKELLNLIYSTKTKFSKKDNVEESNVEEIKEEETKFDNVEESNEEIDNKEDEISYTANIFRNLLLKKELNEDGLSKAYRIIESCESKGVEFLKAALYENGYRDKDILKDVNKEWIKTFNTYYNFKEEALEGNLTYLKIFKILSEKPEKVVNLFNKMKSGDLEMKEILEKFPIQHRNFMEMLIEKDVGSLDFQFTKKFKELDEMNLGQKLSLNLDDYYKEIVEQNKIKDGMVFGTIYKEDSDLIKIDYEDIDTYDFESNYVTQYSNDLFKYSIIPEATENQYLNFKQALAKQLSNNDYSKVDKQYIGKYQLDAATLAKYDLIDKEKFNSLINNTNKNKMNEIYEEFIKNPDNWNKNKCASLESFLKNPKLQEELMDVQTMSNYKDINKNVRNYSTNDSFKSLDALKPWETFGLLSVAHVAGVDNTMNLIEDGNSTFTNKYGGKVLEKYYKIGKQATKIDINQSLVEIEKAKYNFVDIAKDYSICDRMFNPMVQFEYYSKEFGQLFNNVFVAINNHRYANAQKEIERINYDKVLNKIENDISNIKNKPSYLVNDTSNSVIINNKSTNNDLDMLDFADQALDKSKTQDIEKSKSKQHYHNH